MKERFRISLFLKRIRNGTAKTISENIWSNSRHEKIGPVRRFQLLLWSNRQGLNKFTYRVATGIFKITTTTTTIDCKRTYTFKMHLSDVLDEEMHVEVDALTARLWCSRKSCQLIKAALRSFE